MGMGNGQSSGHHATASSHQGQPDRPSAPAPIPQPGQHQPQAVHYQNPCHSGDTHDASELCAQWTASVAARDATDWIPAQAAIPGVEAVGVVLSLIASSVAVIVALKGLFHSQKSTKRELRAYVAVVTPSVIPTDAPAVEWKVQLEWINAGATPAKNLIGCVRSKVEHGKAGLPEDFDFPNGAIKGGSMAIGPHVAFKSLGPEHLSTSELELAAMELARVFVWGWVEYDDVFGDEGRRRTECAYELLCEKTRGGALGLVFNPLTRHNGIDEGCMKKPSR